MWCTLPSFQLLAAGAATADVGQHQLTSPTRRSRYKTDRLSPLWLEVTVSEGREQCTGSYGAPSQLLNYIQLELIFFFHYSGLQLYQLIPKQVLVVLLISAFQLLTFFRALF